MNSVVLVLLAASLSFFDGGHLFTTPAPQDAPATKKSIPAKKGGTLEVDVEPGSVELEPWDKDEVVVEAEDIDDEHPEKFSVTQSGATVRLTYRDHRWRSENVRFHVSLPAEFSVNVKTSGGSVIQHDKLQGKFVVDTRGGSIEIDEHVGNVEVRSNGGNIKVDKIDGDGKMRTGGGNVSVKMTTGELNVESGGGTMNVAEVGKRLEIRTGGGNISLGDISGESVVHTGGGSVRTGTLKGKARLETGGGHVDVKGTGAELYVKSGGGTVRLHQIKGALDASTGGGDLEVELLASESGESQIFSGGGDISLSVPENSKARISAVVNERSNWGGGGRHKRIDIRSDFKADKYDKSEDGIEATYVLNGGGHNIAVETSNGIINIRKLK